MNKLENMTIKKSNGPYLYSEFMKHFLPAGYNDSKDGNFSFDISVGAQELKTHHFHVDTVNGHLKS